MVVTAGGIEAIHLATLGCWSRATPTGERRDRLVALLERLGVPCHRPAGVFSAWVDVADRAGSARRFALELLLHQRVAVAPGSAFGPAGEGWVRRSLAAETDTLLEGARRRAGFALT